MNNPVIGTLVVLGCCISGRFSKVFLRFSAGLTFCTVVIMLS